MLFYQKKSVSEGNKMPWANSGSAGNGKLTTKRNAYVPQEIYNKNIHLREDTSHVYKSTSEKVVN